MLEWKLWSKFVFANCNCNITWVPGTRGTTETLWALLPLWGLDFERVMRNKFILLHNLHGGAQRAVVTEAQVKKRKRKCEVRMRQRWPELSLPLKNIFLNWSLSSWETLFLFSLLSFCSDFLWDRSWWFKVYSSHPTTGSNSCHTPLQRSTGCITQDAFDKTALAPALILFPVLRSGD